MPEFARFLFFVGLLSASLSWAAADQSATLAGQTVRPGGRLDIRFAVSKAAQDYAAVGGNPRPTAGRAVLALPRNFDPARSWPILVVISTADANRTSPMDEPYYEHPATVEGWVVLASDATIHPRVDSTSWRLGILVAALEALRKDWPQSARWPVAFAGFSGGAKCSSTVGAMLAKSGIVKVCGFFLAGLNQDRLSEAYKAFHLSPDFLNTPIWLSSGLNDRIASPGKQEHVKSSLEQTGFRRVRIEMYDGGHQVEPADVQEALRWFREIGNF